MTIRRMLWVLWPAFLVAALATGLVFAVVDPGDVHLFGHPVEASREAVYTLGFLAAWVLCALSSGLTLYILPGKLTDPGEPE